MQTDWIGYLELSIEIIIVIPTLIILFNRKHNAEKWYEYIKKESEKRRL